jgi:hypothetical protein
LRFYGGKNGYIPTIMGGAIHITIQIDILNHIAEILGDGLWECRLNFNNRSLFIPKLFMKSTIHDFLHHAGKPLKRVWLC